MPDQKDTVLGGLAVERGYLKPEQLDEALANQRKMREEMGIDQPLAQILIGKRWLNEDQLKELTKAVAVETGAVRVVGGYEVVARLGQGGMGAVYKARKLDTGQFVALKVLPPSLATESLVARFKREAEITRKLKSDNIVGCVEFGFDARRKCHFCALEFIEGEDLRARIKKGGRLSEKEAIAVARGIANALRDAYLNGLVHRDVKPANIMVTPEGKAKLLDLGLARPTDRKDVRLTQSGAFVGSAYYASPEQASGRDDIDIRADVYSLAATLYHMVTGSPPFDGGTVMTVLQSQISRTIPWPAEVAPGVSDELSAVIAKAMAKDPDERYETPDDLMADLDRVTAEEEPAAVLGAPKKSTVARPRRRPLAARSRAGRHAAGAAREGGRRPHAEAGEERSKMPYAIVGGALAGLAALGIIFAARRPKKRPREEPPPVAAVHRDGPAPPAKVVEPPAPPVVAPEPPADVVEPVEEKKPDDIFAVRPPVLDPPVARERVPEPPSGVEFGGRRYKLFTQKMDWHEAKRFCEEKGGHLVTITSAEENDFVKGLARRGGERAWIGYTDEREEGKWEWVTGEPGGPVSWQEGEPNDGKRPGRPQDWAYLNPGADYGWADYRVGIGYCFVCEWEPAGATREPVAVAATRGLLGTYFIGTDFEEPVLERIDPQVHFNWRGGSPAPDLPGDDFSVRWEGFIVPPATGNYVLSLRSDDGVRLWVGGKQLLDKWVGGVLELALPPVPLEGGRPCEVKLEYMEAKGQATVNLLWRGPGIAEAVAIPPDCLRPPAGHGGPAVLAARSPGTVYLARGLAGHWKFDEAEGETARDSSTKGSDGTVRGATWAQGKIGGALEFDGSKDYVLLPDGVKSAVDFTFAAWAFWDGGGTWQRIFDFGTERSRHLTLITRTPDNTFRFQITNGGDPQRLNGPTLPTGRWVHVAVTLSGDTGTLYVDGASVDTSPDITINPSDFGGTRNFLGWSQYKDAQDYFKGRLDDVRIYDRALPAEEVKALFEGRRGPVRPPEPEEPKKPTWFLVELDELLMKGDHAGAQAWLAKAAGDDKHADAADAIAAALKVCKTIEARAGAAVQGAKAHTGEKVDLAGRIGRRKGEVKEVNEEGIVLVTKYVIAAGGKRLEKEKRLTVRWAELAPGQVDELARKGGWKSAGPDAAIAAAYMALGRKDQDAAAKALGAAGDHPLAGNVRRKLEELAFGEVEAAAIAAWRGIERKGARRRLSEPEAKALLAGIESFEKEYGKTKCAASMAGKISALRKRCLAAIRTDELVVEVPLAGGDELHVRSGGIFWKNQQGPKPGMQRGMNGPTWVNGEAWMPKWGFPAAPGGPDTSEPLPINFGSPDLELEFLMVGPQRTSTGITRPPALRKRGDENEVVFAFARRDGGGSRWHRFRLFRREPPSPLPKGMSVAFHQEESMKLYPIGYRQSYFPRQETDDATGAFRGEPVYFNQKTGRDVLYEVRTPKAVRKATIRMAAMEHFMVEILDANGRPIWKSGRHEGGNRWATFEMQFPPRQHFLMRLHNEISTWLFIDRIDLE